MLILPSKGGEYLKICAKLRRKVGCDKRVMCFCNKVAKARVRGIVGVRRFKMKVDWQFERTIINPTKIKSLLRKTKSQTI